MAANFTKLRNLLAELFMFEFADLDFGIYKVMAARRDDVRRFLDEDLLPQVRAELGKVESGERKAVQEQLAKAEENARDAGFNPDDSPRVKALREKLAATGDPVALEEEVFSHLATFFRRYYKDGDYLSLRRYKKDVYALPYEGEEVKLHWANADQYYIKSSEHFRDYTFKLADGRRVHFKLVEADSEQNNNKAAEGKERRFALVDEEPIVEEDDDLLIRFAYCPSSDKQAALNRATIARVVAIIGESFPGWSAGLREKKGTEKEPERTLLEKHLGDYTARNSFDYFIHKDLRGFLRRELDFFIKSEVMLLDDIEEETAPRVEQYLAKVRAIRRIAHKIIDMLGQLESFQKRLWLKKKFVVETNYCVTLDRVPEELYGEIAANEAQREEWVRLFAIDAIVNTTISPNYSAPLTVDFLKANPFLVLDTKFFPPAFKARLLASFDDLDAQLDGLLVHSENFQALQLLQERYRGQVQTVFIDPPYNTNNEDFNYKDNYRHSSWLSMITDRLMLSKHLSAPKSALFATIDDNELTSLLQASTRTYGDNRFRTTIVWQKKDTPANDALGISATHDYLLVVPVDDGFERGLFARTEEQQALYKNQDNDSRGPWTRTSLVVKRFVKGNDYPLINPAGQEVRPPSGLGWSMTRERMQELIDDKRIWWGQDADGVPYRKTFLSEVNAGVVPVTWWDYKFAGSNRNARAELRALFIGEPPFDTPKPTALVTRILELASGNLVLDFFAGSGTTAHAVINRNRQDGGKRQYIMVEMGAYFDTVLKPRVLKVIYSKDWKDGRPVSREGSSHLLKYIRLESYEDALNNLELRRTDIQSQLLLDEPELREDYMLRYMLDVESHGSQSLLNVDAFAHPFDYTLNVANGSVGETEPRAIDLVETFNYLLGLRVKQIDRVRDVVTVEGRNPEGQRVLVIWRDVARTDNVALEEFFRKQGYSTRDQEFDLIYVNGDNNLENIRRDDETWKVRLIEQEFQQLMFDVRDI